MKRAAQYDLVTSTPIRKPKLNRQPARRNVNTTPNRNLLAVELKYNDVNSTVDITTTPTVVGLNTMSSGDTVILRDGNKIQCRSIEIRAAMTAEIATTNAIIRMVVVHDKNANLADPTWTQVFNTATPQSLRAIGNMSRFTLLMDKTFALNNVGGGTQKLFIKKYLKIPQDLQLTSFTDGSATTPVSGSLTLMYLSDVVAGVIDTDMQLQVRTRFIG